MGPPSSRPQFQRRPSLHGAISHKKFPFQFVLDSVWFIISHQVGAQTRQPKNNSQSNDIVSLSVSLSANDSNLNLAISKWFRWPESRDILLIVPIVSWLAMEVEWQKQREMGTHYITLPPAFDCHLFLPQELHVRCLHGNRIFSSKTYKYTLQIERRQKDEG